MTTPYYQDDSVTLYHGADIDVLRELPDQSVNCCVTSPPYFGLRDYGIDGQRGLEQSPAEYVAGMVEVFAEIRRVLADDGTLWLNLGDSYSAKRSYQVDQTKVQASGKSQPDDTLSDRPAKSLLGIPWRVAFALQDDGWILRNAIVWHKQNAMPESVTDRLSSRYEMVFLLTSSRRYRFNLDAIREAPLREAIAQPRANDEPWNALTGLSPHAGYRGSHPGGKNPGDVWSLTSRPFPGAHVATMPTTLAERCILAGSAIGDTVLDPYSGSGTTGMVATRHGRRYVGIDLNRDYLDLSLRTRLGQATITDGVA